MADDLEHVDIPGRNWLIVANFVLVVVALVAFATDRPAWEVEQETYTSPDPDFRGGLLSVRSEAIGGQVELCATCHPATAGYPAVPGSVRHAAHPDVSHQPTVMGCVACHGGDPDSLLPHDIARYGMDPPLSGDEAWVGCLHCHSAPHELADWPGAVRAQEVIAGAVLDNGCLGCHHLVARGGRLGPDLGSLGRGRGADPHVPTETVRTRIERQIAPDRALASLMPVVDLDPDERRFVGAWLSTNGRITDGDRARWAPGEDLETGEQVFGAFCSGCHGASGEGVGGGAIAGGVPAVGSRLFAAAADRDFVRRTIAEGRRGTLMVGFAPGLVEPEAVGERLLSEHEVDLVTDLLVSGDRAPEGTRTDEVTAASCAACHPGRPALFEDLSDAERVVALGEHPKTLDVLAFARDEGVPWPPGVPETTDAQATLDEICGSCHRDPRHRNPRADAPVIRDYRVNDTFDDGFFLMTLVLGRGDAAPGRWRHEGMLDGQLTLPQMLALVVAARGEEP